MSLVKCCFEADAPGVFEPVIQKCIDPGCCCWCCSALRPRYKRLVDNIFPVNPQDGLVKNNMEKLTFYSLSSPEKLDRIGEYLFQRASRDIYRRRNGFVIIAMEAMDQLLVACHAQTLNLFVESFLKMVQKLLESSEPQLQILATQSFVRFANIEEDTPSYHTRYDFFVSKFSAMCHSNHNDLAIRKQIRLAGIQGLQGVVRKTLSDDLVENIWEPVHMDKIVPSLLYNMQNSRYFEKENATPESPAEERSDPPQFAESCMRELVGRASFGHIRCVIRPVLRHLDLHQLWVPNCFAIHTFRIIMFSIQSQYSYTVVEALMTHLDENSKSTPKIRTSIADTLSKIISIAAGESVGPSVLEIINSLLSHLRVSVTRNLPSSNDEQLYQEALINALGEFANHLPDYQKIEIMMFIMSKVPYSEPDSTASVGKGDVLLQSILLKSLLKVGTKYQTIHLNTTFPISFLEPLLRMSLAPDPEMRLLVQKILHTLIDRHRNIDKLATPTVNIGNLELVIEKSSRPDVIFVRKHGPEIYQALYESLELPSNTVENIEAVYTTLALLAVELATEETVLELLRLVLSLQDLALTSGQISNSLKFNLHAVVMSLLVLISYVCNITSLMDYASKLVEAREKEAVHLLPELKSRYDGESQLSTRLPPSVIIDQAVVSECLKGAGLDTGKLQQGPGYSSSSLQHRHSWVDSTGRSSMADINAGGAELDSAGSSPGVQKKLPGEELTFESMKRILTESGETRREAEEERRLQLSQLFRTAPFQDLVVKTQPKHDMLQNKLSEIFNTLTVEPRNPIQPGIPPADAKPSQTPAYEVHFPELFVY
ncbi:protein EFR3 homolog cmp44E isoform X1 [Neodiprion pinetum]|uniref:protein EFR3 homolog cmp44E isoform X1 n=1 Tax=Neodiprion pinetum TaxID=441929 RepID=UPI001EDE3DCB|nr:protein EFR3 homolog cmp44E isoform X1 [Neodiprion pinetum]XP_046612140.1 protein EFR3 homolog cmp44E isoform X1 [Neodiprion virginianus]